MSAAPTSRASRPRPSTISTGNVGEGYEATNNVDFTAHYNITRHLKATLEGLNLTDQHIIQYTDLQAHRIEVNTSSGRTIL